MTRWTLSIALLAALVATGCATKKYTRETVEAETKPIHSRIDDVEGELEETQTRMETQHTQLRGEVQEVSKTAQEALQRAQEAGKLAEGKLLYETVLTDDKVRFGFESSKLSDEATAAIDQFAADLKQQNKNVYVEIQGHTDSTGAEAYNEQLAQERAEAVRTHLSREHKIPLHRMNVISYGEAEPIADNDTREGRAQNRRVTLVVLE